MATEIVTIQSVDTKSGEKNGKRWQLWKVHLQDGRTLSTFSSAPGNAAMSAIGEQRQVDIEERARDGYPPDLILDAVRPVPNGAKPTPQTKQQQAQNIVPAEVWEAKDRRIAREVCLKAVVELYAHREVAIPRTEDLLARASEFERWIYREEQQASAKPETDLVAADPDPDSDIPFAPTIA